jgi:phosphoglycerate dehydrogenase-like enzyme
LFFAKDFRRLVRNQAAAVWEQFDVERVAGKIIGIVGYGDIGRAIAVRARALEMVVLGLKRHVAKAEKADGLAERLFSPEQRLEMIAQCDYVAVAAPLTEETRGIVGKQEIAAMKPGAVVINVGRGPLIDESELVRALTDKRIRGAALDVFNQEPLPPGHPFYKLENVLLSPHSADHTVDWLHNATLFFAEQFGRYTRGEKLHNVVDKALGY